MFKKLILMALPLLISAQTLEIDFQNAIINKDEVKVMSIIEENKKDNCNLLLSNWNKVKHIKKIKFINKSIIDNSLLECSFKPTSTTTPTTTK